MVSYRKTLHIEGNAARKSDRNKGKGSQPDRDRQTDRQ